MDWLSLGGSLLAVIMVVLVVRGLGMGKATLDDPAEAEALARHMVGGFRPSEAVLCSRGAAALLAGEAGDFVVLKRLGSQFAARRIDAGARAHLREDGSRPCLVIDSSERFFGHVALQFDDAGQAARWRDRLCGGPRCPT